MFVRIETEAVAVDADEVLIDISTDDDHGRYEVKIEYDEENREHRIIVGDEIVWCVVEGQQ